MTAQWADGPWPLIETPAKTMDIKRHAAVQIANEMCHPHNLMIRGINSIYLQAPHVKKPADIADFLYFCGSWCQLVAQHHKEEEDFFFPAVEKAIEKPGFFDGEVEEHHTFLIGFDEMRKYLKETTPETFSAARLNGIIDKFATDLQKHLSGEIQTLLALEKEPKADGATLLKIANEAGERAVKELGSETLPFILGLCDRTYEGGIHNFPPGMPAFVPWLAHYWFARPHRGAWRFCPSDTWKKPRPLMFLPENQGASS
ncbi:hypothetical protein BOTBODRAFT_172044 [Botryobasidium botryosum FD-172 SS1]|uniref:Hemerythrin-like domain-containing protein n=1 Tax=Botryobasidium botryosum (strain FD-172 SS1) TaxID=930990 RepID=A0A067N1C5_BOTB1|nr:hypothetical protein BOTBODRAFT_172044 [Botryobasidium botryosum FD-172 SS1]